LFAGRALLWSALVSFHFVDCGGVMPDGQTTTDKGVSAQRLKSFIQRIERLEEERKALGGDLREVYSEAKGGGFDVKIIRQVVKLRKMDKADRQEQEALLQVYLDAVGE
jgi:uncharacterized protein (UPF0335 family)